MKTNQAGQKTWQEAPHALKKRPRAKNSANMVVQGPNKVLSVAWLGSPLSMLKQHFLLYIKHIGLTRLGTDSGAADLTAPPCHRPLGQERNGKEWKGKKVKGKG